MVFQVDISTMLEEAVQYVKFLQLQIKVTRGPFSFHTKFDINNVMTIYLLTILQLLSSDELWMYAPIAYNGMNIGIDLKISPPQ